MGTNCGKHYEPTPHNICNVDEINYIPEHFCTLEGPAGTHHREWYCSNMSNNEWHDYGSAEGCKYNDCNERENYGEGCCNGCCGIDGKSVKCGRVKYRGNPFTCCFLDYNCKPNDGQCFQDVTQQRTCPAPSLTGNGLPNQPNYRNLGSKDCREITLDFCMGNPVEGFYYYDGTEEIPWDGSQWKEAWFGEVDVNDWIPVLEDTFGVDTDKWSGSAEYTSYNNKHQARPIQNACQKAVIRAIFSQAAAGETSCNYSEVANMSFNSGSVDADGFLWAQEVVEGLFNRFLKEGGTILGNINTDGIVDQQVYQFLLNTCTQFPGLCRGALSNLCAGVTVKTINQGGDTLSWCGCYMDDSQYEQYINDYQLTKQCTPFCNKSQTIKLAAANGVDKLQCLQNVCIIDDQVIDLINNVFEGQPEFGQICSSCGVSFVTSEASSKSVVTAAHTKSTKHGQHREIGQYDGAFDSTSVTNTDINSCKCILQGQTFISANSSLANLDLLQNCGNSSVCYKTVTEGGVASSIPVSCSDGKVTQIEQVIEDAEGVAEAKAKSISMAKVLIIFTVMLALFIITWIFFPPKTMSVAKAHFLTTDIWKPVY